MKRVVRPELLDELAADDPRAVRSRRDLRRINAWMGNAGIAARALTDAFPRLPPQQIVEIGAGDGVFLLNMARTLSRSGQWDRRSTLDVQPGSALLVDRQNLLGAETQTRLARFNWSSRVLQADVFDFFENGAPAADVVIANLFLHHFSAGQLNRLFRLAGPKVQVLIAVEPRRSRLALLFSRLLWIIGCGPVTRHDAVASVRAGFAGLELSTHWPDRDRWQIREQAAGPFSHLFVARRKN
jgi:hypothetical protein